MVCGDTADNDPYIRRKPVLIIEVTSPGTERIDHHEKLIAYKGIDTLVEYVLVAQDRLQIEVHRRKEDRWQQPEFLSEAGEVLRLESVGLDLTLGEVYSNVRLGQAG
jgi:Uma2 family endonuclease